MVSPRLPEVKMHCSNLRIPGPFISPLWITVPEEKILGKEGLEPRKSTLGMSRFDLLSLKKFF